MAKRLLQVVWGWARSVKELFWGIVWVVLHPIQFIIEVFGLVYSLILSATHIHKAGSFLKGALYEPYRAMTVMAVVGGVLAFYSHFLHADEFSAIAAILLSASGFAYIMWRSVEFFHGKHKTADAIDGFIFVTELLPVVSSIAIVARFVRFQTVLARTSAMTGRLTGNVARSGSIVRSTTAVRAASRSSRGVLKAATAQNKILKSFSKVHKATLHTLETAQPVISIGEWVNHWLKVGDSISREVIDTLRGVEREIKGMRR
ncbi:MAG: hypothetical protein J7K68_02165 [Candidatus Diapherotrites archaeon]|nr:hypothetical protein [Candidatus Diapherotrites archaeon]